MQDNYWNTFEGLNTKSPKDNEPVFHFPEWQSENKVIPSDFQEPKVAVSIKKEVEEHAKTTSTGLFFKRGGSHESTAQATEDNIEEIIAPFKKELTATKSKVVRRDVINKTIFRIIRRFYYTRLEQIIPDYKEQKKNSLFDMLRSFVVAMFPSVQDPTEMVEVLSALMFRREILLSHKEFVQRKDLNVFLNIQSKYSHKLLQPALTNTHFRILFDYFLQNGIDFLKSDENFLNNQAHYTEEFDKIKEIYFNM